MRREENGNRAFFAVIGSEAHYRHFVIDDIRRTLVADIFGCIGESVFKFARTHIRNGFFYRIRRRYEQVVHEILVFAAYRVFGASVGNGFPVDSYGFGKAAPDALRVHAGMAVRCADIQ